MTDDEGAYICSNCGEEIIVPIDLSQGHEQEYVEDCPVCCHPMVISVTLELDGSIEIDSQAE